MSFFDSEVVRAEMAEISDLQEDIYRNVFEFPRMTKEEKMFHVSLLEKLLNKQQILYTRLKFSEDPEAVQMKKRIQESARMMGMADNVDMSVIFNNMTKLLESMKERIDKTGSDQ